MAIRVTVWNEYLHEVQFPEVAEVYPKGIHGCIADFLKDAGMEVRTATLREPEHGLAQEVLDNTDVLIWWGHMAHHEVADEIVDRVYKRVLEGMGLIVLHSGHASKIFQKLCGTDTWKLKWREDGEKVRGRRSVPQRVLLAPGQGKDLLFPPRPRGVPHLSSAGDPACDHQRGEVGRAHSLPQYDLWQSPAGCACAGENGAQCAGAP